MKSLNFTPHFDMSQEQLGNQNEKKGFIKWLKRLGIAGFLFFLIKGLIWLAVLYGGLHVAGC